MISLVSDVLDEARVLLNDSGGVRYNNTILLPIFKKAYRELERRFKRSSVPRNNEVSSTIIIPALATSIPPGGGAGQMPPDLSYPLTLVEKGVLDVDFIPMEERQWEPFERQTNILGVWVWRQQEIKLLGATEIRHVRIRYVDNVPAITAPGDQVLIDDSEQYLASKVASIAAFSIAQNAERAAALDTAAENDYEELVSYHTKKYQGIRVRRKQFSRRRRWG